MKHEKIAIPTMDKLDRPAFPRAKCQHDFQHSPEDYVSGKLDQYRCTKCKVLL